LEHGLEPHRIIRLLHSLGAKERTPPLQVFMTTHSPVALRELSGAQLHVLRASADRHEARQVGTADDIQSTIRLYPDAFLAPSVIVCEGASEVGLVRGLDQFRSAAGRDSISALGVALTDCAGGDPDRPFRRAQVFQGLGYRVAVLRDDDQKPTAAIEQAFVDRGGSVIAWRDGRCLEDELFRSVSAQAVTRLIERAIELHGEELINDHIKSASQNARDLAAIRTELASGAIAAESRAFLGNAATVRRAGWFKSVTWMEDVARDIVGPDLPDADAGFRGMIDAIFAWAGNAG
jgi:hypothetical protein